MIRFCRNSTALAIVMLAALPALSGIVIEQTIESDGFGGRKLGQMTATTRTWVDGERSRSETDAQHASKWMARFSGGPRADITRLDKGLIWNLNLEKRNYTEMTFAEFRQMREQSAAMLGGFPGGEEAPPQEEEVPDVPTMEFSPPEITVDRPGNRETIAGFDSEQVSMTVTTTGTHSETGDTCTVVWSNEIWIAETGTEEAMRAYYEKMAEELGFDGREVQALGSSVLSMLTKYGSGWDSLEEQMAGLEGTPMRSVTTMTVDGACGAGPSEGPQVEMPSAKDALKSSGKKLFGKLGKLGLGRKKKAEPQPEVAAAEPAPAGPRQLFSMKTETTVLRIEDVDPLQFEVPTGYKKVERKPFAAPPSN